MEYSFESAALFNPKHRRGIRPRWDVAPGDTRIHSCSDAAVSGHVPALFIPWTRGGGEMCRPSAFSATGKNVVAEEEGSVGGWTNQQLRRRRAKGSKMGREKKSLPKNDPACSAPLSCGGAAGNSVRGALIYSVPGEPGAGGNGKGSKLRMYVWSDLCTGPGRRDRGGFFFYFYLYFLSSPFTDYSDRARRLRQGLLQNGGLRTILRGRAWRGRKPFMRAKGKKCAVSRASSKRRYAQYVSRQDINRSIFLVFSDELYQWSGRGSADGSSPKISLGRGWGTQIRQLRVADREIGRGFLVAHALALAPSVHGINSIGAGPARTRKRSFASLGRLAAPLLEPSSASFREEGDRAMVPQHVIYLRGALVGPWGSRKCPVAVFDCSSRRSHALL